MFLRHAPTSEHSEPELSSRGVAAGCKTEVLLLQEDGDVPFSTLSINWNTCSGLILCMALKEYVVV